MTGNFVSSERRTHLSGVWIEAPDRGEGARLLGRVLLHGGVPIHPPRDAEGVDAALGEVEGLADVGHNHNQGQGCGC